MFPYEQMEARAWQKMDRYRSDAERHRQIKADRHGPWLPRLRNWLVGRNGLDRFGIRRIARVLSGDESGPILPAT